MMSYMEIATYLGMLNIAIGSSLDTDSEYAQNLNNKMREALVDSQFIITNLAMEEVSKAINKEDPDVHD